MRTCGVGILTSLFMGLWGGKRGLVRFAANLALSSEPWHFHRASSASPAGMVTHTVVVILCAWTVGHWVHRHNHTLITKPTEAVR